MPSAHQDVTEDFVLLDFWEAIVGHQADRLTPRQTVAHASGRVDEAADQPTVMSQADGGLRRRQGRGNCLKPGVGPARAT